MGHSTASESASRSLTLCHSRPLVRDRHTLRLRAKTHCLLQTRHYRNIWRQYVMTRRHCCCRVILRYCCCYRRHHITMALDITVNAGDDEIHVSSLAVVSDESAYEIRGVIRIRVIIGARYAANEQHNCRDRYDDDTTPYWHCDTH